MNEAALTLENTSLPGQQPDKIETISPNKKKKEFQWHQLKMRKTKKKQDKKQNLMTHLTLEKKTKIKDELLPQATLKMILQIIQTFKDTVHKKHVQRIKRPQRKRNEETKKKNDKYIYKRTRNSSMRCNFTEWLSWTFSIRY